MTDENRNRKNIDLPSELSELVKLWAKELGISESGLISLEEETSDAWSRLKNIKSRRKYKYKVDIDDLLDRLKKK